MERASGIEPPLLAWEASVLPLNHARGPWRLRASNAKRKHLFQTTKSGQAFFSLSFPLRLYGPHGSSAPSDASLI